MSRGKKVGFQKVKSISITVTKYEPLTPNELGAILNLPKNIKSVTLLMFSGNSLSFLFKDFSQMLQNKRG